jgi:hypothetical protein
MHQDLQTSWHGQCRWKDWDWANRTNVGNICRLSSCNVKADLCASGSPHRLHSCICARGHRCNKDLSAARCYSDVYTDVVRRRDGNGDILDPW